jgi:hypothetical protein
MSDGQLLVKLEGPSKFYGSDISLQRIGVSEATPWTDSHEYGKFSRKKNQPTLAILPERQTKLKI